MNCLRMLLERLALVENPFNISESYIVPARGDGARDAVRVANDFHAVFNVLGDCTRAELSRHGISAY